MEWGINLKSISLKKKLWFYLTLFVFGILLILWFFQILFLNTFYEFSKRQTMEEISKELKRNYKKEQDLNKLASEKGICIQIIHEDQILYSSTSYNRGCYLTEKSVKKYKEDFIKSQKKMKTYEIMNPKFHNKTLLKGIKLNEKDYAFVSTSLMPLDSSIQLLKRQFIYVAIFVFLFAFILGYFISKKLSQPLDRLNQDAKKLAKGDYQVSFKTTTDIQEINDLAHTLSYTRDELSKTEELRRDLLANVGHDLKTPLTMIKAYAEMVRDITYKDKKKREENLNIIIEESDRLNLLVEDILELSKMQANHNDFDMEPFPLHQTILNVLKRYEILKEKEKYQFLYENKTEYMVLGNKKGMEQVLYNLINNAINYTGEDKKVELVVLDSKGEVTVQIKDTGKGIKKEDIPYIWDKYYHSEKKHKRNKIGTGLGLSIVKNILENQKSSYGVKSSNHGTTFYFSLKKSKTKIRRGK